MNFMLFLFCLISSLISFGITFSNVNNIAYRVKLALPKTNQTLTTYAYYKGNRLRFDRNSCTVFESYQRISIPLLLLAPEYPFQPKIHGKHIQCLTLPKKAKFRFFYLQYFPLQEAKNIVRWYVEEVSKENLPKRIPDDALIVFIDPNLIERFDDLSCSYNHKGFITFIDLPKLILKPSLSEDEIADHELMTACTLPEISITHQPLLHTEHFL